MHLTRIVGHRRRCRAPAIDDQDLWRRMESLFSTERTGLPAAGPTKTVLRCLHPHTAGHDRIPAGVSPSLTTTIDALAARATLRSLRKPQGSAGTEGQCSVLVVWQS